MRRTRVISGLIVALCRPIATGGLTSAAMAGLWEDGMAAYHRGDYVPVIRLFRSLAEQGNPKALSVMG